MQSYKGLLDEHVKHQAESIRALLRASINRETAERHLENERLTKMCKKLVDAAQLNVESQLGQEVEKLIMRIEMNKTEFTLLRDKHESRLQHLHQKTNMLQDKVQKLMESVFGKLEANKEEVEKEKEDQLRQDEVKKCLDYMIEVVCAKESKKESKSVQERLDQIEVRSCVQWMVDKVSMQQQDLILESVVEQIGKYVMQVNQTAHKQYSDFQSKVKENFGENMKQVNELLGALSDEVAKSSASLSELKT